MQTLRLGVAYKDLLVGCFGGVNEKMCQDAFCSSIVGGSLADPINTSLSLPPIFTSSHARHPTQCFSRRKRKSPVEEFKKEAVKVALECSIFNIELLYQVEEYNECVN